MSELSRLACLTFTIAFLAAAAGHAEEAHFPLERFRPAIDGAGVLDVDSGTVGGHLQWSVGAFVNYALNPLVLRQDGARVGSLLTHRVGLDVVAALSLFDWVQLGVDAPFVLLQARDSAEAGAVVSGAQDVSAVGVGDLRLLAKVRVLRARDQGVDLAIIPALTVPTGLPAGDTGNYLGEGQVTFAPELALSRTFDDGVLSGLRLATNVGYRLRPEERRFANVVVGHELTFRAGVGYRLAAMPLSLELSGNGATYAFQPFSSGFEENPLEVIGGVSYDLLPWLRGTVGVGKGIISGVGTPDVRVLAGLRLVPVDDGDRDHDGLKDDADGCPDDPEDKDGFKDDDGCPDVDNDEDGVKDVDDGAPNDPEDRDGFEDADGVPDPDNDKDGVLDVDDACPNEPGKQANHGCPINDRDGDGVLDSADACVDVVGLAELDGCPDTDGDGLTDSDDRCPTVFGARAQKGCPDADGDGFVDVDDDCPKEPETINGVDDEDGCPDKGKTIVKLTGQKIEILEKVYFDVNKATIQRRSDKLLDQVATLLRSHPELTKVRIEGHTDSDGSDTSNLDLSDRRAMAVKAALEARGVDGARLSAVGYGESRPVVKNTSKANKEQNRRVEFVVVELDGKSTDSQTIRSPQ